MPRRIKFVIHQARIMTSDVKTIVEDRIKNPELTKSITNVRNSISITNFDYNENAKTINSGVEKHTDSDSNSIIAYGEKRLEVNNKPGDGIFMYDSGDYATFLASHYKLLFKEPPQVLKMKTDMYGFNFDLKDLIKIKERDGLKLDHVDQEDVSGIFELSKLNFNTSSFRFDFEMLWAAYLLYPLDENGLPDLNARYSFTENLDGTANAWAYGEWTVNVNGTTVTKTAGDDFITVGDPEWEGKKIIIETGDPTDPDETTIVSITDGTHLEVADSYNVSNGKTMKPKISYHAW